MQKAAKIIRETKKSLRDFFSLFSPFFQRQNEGAFLKYCFFFFFYQTSFVFEISLSSSKRNDDVLFEASVPIS